MTRSRGATRKQVKQQAGNLKEGIHFPAYSPPEICTSMPPNSEAYKQTRTARGGPRGLGDLSTKPELLIGILRVCSSAHTPTLSFTISTVSCAQISQLFQTIPAFLYDDLEAARRMVLSGQWSLNMQSQRPDESPLSALIFFPRLNRDIKQRMCPFSVLA